MAIDPTDPDDGIIVDPPTETVATVAADLATSFTAFCTFPPDQQPAPPAPQDASLMQWLIDWLNFVLSANTPVLPPLIPQSRAPQADA